MSKRSCEAAESIEMRFMTIECPRSVHSIVLNGAGELAQDYKKQRRRLMKLQILVSS